MTRVAVSWSTGKDSAWALHRLREEPGVEVVGLLTTVTPEFGRVSIHGTRRDVLRAQAGGLGLPLWEVELPYPCPNEAYEAAMLGATAAIAEQWGVSQVAFGDLYLEDIRAYRERLMARTPLEPVFPLWGLDTGELARGMADGGIEAVVVSAPLDSAALPLVGRPWRPETVAALGAGVDPCGENGEFHTCVVAAPGLDRLGHRMGEVVEREGARYADLILDGT